MGGCMCQMGGWMGAGMWTGMWLWTGLGVLLVTALVAAVVVLAVRARGSAGPWPAGPGSARHELDLRYARGELQREEYLERRTDLEDPRRPWGPEP
jgi:putative membrane protein